MFRRPTWTRKRAPHILIIVQNLPVPLDRRVWLECQALVTRGYRVSVICPKGPGDPVFEHLDGVDIHKYAPAPEAEGLAGYAWEFAYSWVRTALLSVKVRRRGRFDVIQACNPPDTYWLLALLWRVAGVRFVYDHHDLNPELFRSRFGEPQGTLKKLEYRTLLWLERRSFRAADHVISTNESYKGKAITRGGRSADEVTVVRSGPDTEQMRPIYPEAPRRIDTVNLVYVGIMGPQDGVDQVLHVVDELVHHRGRRNVTATLLGFGDCLEKLKAETLELRLHDHVTFTGRVDRTQMAEYLSRGDIGVCPDLKTPLNDVSTMNKTMEYMAYALPAVAFDLEETQVSGADTVLYAPSGDVAAFADQVERLIDDRDLRARMGRAARERVAAVLDWRPQAEAYVGVYDALTGFHVDGPAVPVTAGVREADAQGRRYVDLHDGEAMEAYLLGRGASDLTVTTEAIRQLAEGGGATVDATADVRS
ncbi:glycosyltransferase family 4 protein [Microbacterium sp. W1N]|uniref:glycosyltransferase family 4 protein n=1 Tax=Microbacterium festucae TaxID=2977531 RepID=UPI0021C1AC5A|nr:glycosyltransferase family 4 protein [Microbacterium festucae]MCT9818980.1 glycosyltransferase family 4 protein [Microbacterium festucae]